MIDYPFKDPAFKEACKHKFGSIASIKKLSLWEACSLEDLPLFTGLETLTLYKCSLSDRDWLVLGACSHLTSLDISNCSLESLDMLSALTRLTQLELRDLNLAHPRLPALPASLNDVCIVRCGLCDLSGLSSASEVTSLRLQNNHIEDLSPISDLTKLTYLNISVNRIRSLEPLLGMTQLTELDANDNRIEDIAPIAALERLEMLEMNSNRLKSLPPLAALAQLESLYLDNNLMEDLSGLSGLGSLQVLSLDHNRIEDISALSSLESLTELCLSNNRIEDISALTALENLTELNLRNNLIEDISALSHLIKLKNVVLDNNRIKDLSPLCSLPKLSHIDLLGNPIPDVTPLKKLPLLRTRSRVRVNVDVSAVADKKTLLKEPLYSLLGECLDYPELEPASVRAERLKKKNPNASYLVNVHPRVHFCRNAMLVRLTGGENRIVLRDLSPQSLSDESYPIYFDDKLLADVNIPSSTLDRGCVGTGYGESVVQHKEAHALLNTPFTGLKHMLPVIHPVLRLLSSGLYLIADFDLFPVCDQSAHFWDAPDYPDYIHFNRYYEPAGASDHYDAPLYLFPTRRASAMDAALVRQYEDHVLEDDFPRCVALYLNGCVSLLLDGHHKAAAAAAQGLPVKTMVIFRVDEETPILKALEDGERLYLMHQDKEHDASGPLLIKNGAGDTLCPVSCLRNAQKQRLYVGKHITDYGPWGSVPEEFKQNLSKLPSEYTLQYGTSIPADGIRKLVESLMDSSMPPRTDDIFAWLDACSKKLSNRDCALDDLKNYLLLHPDTKWITPEERELIEDFSSNNKFFEQQEALWREYGRQKRIKAGLESD